MDRQTVFDYIKKKYHVLPEYPWRKYDSNAVFRHTDNKKWFALVMDVQGNKLGLSGSEYIDVVNLKMDDLFFRDIIIKEDGIMPAYHMNKMHWVTVLLNGMDSFGEEKRKGKTTKRVDHPIKSKVLRHHSCL